MNNFYDLEAFGHSFDIVRDNRGQRSCFPWCNRCGVYAGFFSKIYWCENMKDDRDNYTL